MDICCWTGDFHLSFLMRTVVVSCFRGFTGEMTSDWAGPVGVVSALTPVHSKVRGICRPLLISEILS